MRVVAFVCCVFTMAAAVADDWPQWMGPQRDNVWRETGLLDKFPEGGPKVVWRTPLAGGYAGPAVANGRVYVTDFVRQGDSPGDNFDRKQLKGTERVLCLDEKTGKEIWKQEYPVTYAISYPAGPRCTPLINEGKVYTLGAEGNLGCYDAASGKIVWQKELQKEYNTTAPLWGYAAHPLIDGKKLITLAGGQGTQVVALDKNTGEQIWAALDSPEIGQGYVPPSIIEAGGTRQLIITKPDALSSLDPETGKVHWRVPYTADNGGVIMTPVFTAGHLYQGGFNNRNLLVKLANDKPAGESLWKDKARKGVSPINVQPIAEGDVIYGFDQSGQFTAFKLPDGDRLWQTPQPVAERPANSATAFIVRQGDRYWFFTEKGDVVIGDLSPEGFQEFDRAHVIEPTGDAFGRAVVWCMPAFANKHVFVRNDKECICVDLAK